MLWISFREIAGWALVLIGLMIFGLCALFLIPTPPKFVEAFPMVTIGFIVFRGGVQLLKVAIAARLALPPTPERVSRR